MNGCCKIWRQPKKKWQNEDEEEEEVNIMDAVWKDAYFFVAEFNIKFL